MHEGTSSKPREGGGGATGPPRFADDPPPSHSLINHFSPLCWKYRRFHDNRGCFPGKFLPQPDPPPPRLTGRQLGFSGRKIKGCCFDASIRFCFFGDELMFSVGRRPLRLLTRQTTSDWRRSRIAPFRDRQLQPQSPPIVLLRHTEFPRQRTQHRPHARASFSTGWSKLALL